MACRVHTAVLCFLVLSFVLVIGAQSKTLKRDGEIASFLARLCVWLLL